ncbi:type II toxin-antitoxin system PemK/MazF family toxin [Deinococcus sp.]|uniref:type II toxin-antitoxin system PemK/MazF family toxin n=1 Tax=Deinococcus sp. TaxID=47478 RepID=UPI003B5AD826
MSQPKRNQSGPYLRGAIVTVDLEPVVGSEQGRRRPCIVLSQMNTVRASGARPLYFVVPLTTARKLSGPLAP